MKKNSTKILVATVALVLAMAMSACGSSNNSSSSTTPSAPVSPSSAPEATTTPEATPEELAKKYEDAIMAARDAEAATAPDGENMNKYYPIITNGNKDTSVEKYLADAKENSTEMTPEQAEERYAQELEMLSTVTGIKLEDMSAYAISTTMMNVKAYGIAVVKPVEGKGADVEKALNDYVTAQQKAFESYLVDQKEVADAAIVKTLEDGTVVMVMSENQDAIYDSIVASLSK